MSAAAGMYVKPAGSLVHATWTVPKRRASAIAFCDHTPVQA